MFYAFVCDHGSHWSTSPLILFSDVLWGLKSIIPSMSEKSWFCHENSELSMEFQVDCYFLSTIFCYGEVCCQYNCPFHTDKISLLGNVIWEISFTSFFFFLIFWNFTAVYLDVDLFYLCFLSFDIHFLSEEIFFFKFWKVLNVLLYFNIAF